MIFALLKIMLETFYRVIVVSMLRKRFILIESISEIVHTHIPNHFICSILTFFLLFRGIDKYCVSRSSRLFWLFDLSRFHSWLLVTCGDELVVWLLDLFK